MKLDLNCTQFQSAIGISTYCLGFGVVPLVTASLSEEFGRRPLYMVSSVLFALMHLMVALCVLIFFVIVHILIHCTVI
jgi:MFS family permease